MLFLMIFFSRLSYRANFDPLSSFMMSLTFLFYSLLARDVALRRSFASSTAAKGVASTLVIAAADVSLDSGA